MSGGSSPSRSAGSPRWLSKVGPIALPVGFLALGAWFLWGPRLVHVPLEPPVLVPASAVSTQPVRPARPEPTQIVNGAFTYTCNECHRLFDSAEETGQAFSQHQHIALEHGLNDRCLNCHDAEDREKLVLHAGQTGSFGEAPQLCARCHGPTYRDWQVGMHGRTMNAWDPRSDRMYRLSCIECHDPHKPAYPLFAPLPGPRTLRMGRIVTHDQGHAVEAVDPLRKWESHPPPAGTPGQEHGAPSAQEHRPTRPGADATDEGEAQEKR